MIAHLVSHRLRRGLAALLGGGVVLGLALGLALASFAAARDTASAYGRVLDAADAETAVVAHDLAPDEAAAILDAQPAIARHRYQGGFLAFIEEADPALTGGVLAPAGDEFPLELPTLEAGRLPDPDRADEVFINSVLADATGFQVGQDLTAARAARRTPTSRSSDPVTVTGIGIFPREAVADETALTGIVVPTRAFYEANEELPALLQQPGLARRPPRPPRPRPGAVGGGHVRLRDPSAGAARRGGGAGTDGHRARGARAAGEPRHGGAGGAGGAAAAGPVARRRRRPHRARRHARRPRASSTWRPSPRRWCSPR